MLLKRLEDRYIERLCVCGRRFSDYKDGEETLCSRQCKEREWRKKQLQERNRIIKELREIINEQNIEIVATQKEAYHWREMVEAGSGAIIGHFKHQVDIRQDVIEKYIRFFNEHKHEWEKELE